MWFVEWLLSILTYPIEWFWDKASVYKEEGKKGRVILLFALSLSGVVLFGYALIYGCIWIWDKNIEIVIIGGLIIWLYSYVYSKCVKKQEAQVDLIKLQQENEIEIQARRDYPLLKMLLYRTLKGSADSIGSKPPINVNEIVFQDKPYIISQGVIFYQFQICKNNIGMRYEKEELNEYARTLQNDISRKIRAGDFPQITSDKAWANDGMTYDIINIDGYEDIGNCFLIRVVRYSPQYAEYVKNIHQNMRCEIVAENVPDARWDGH